MPSRKKAEPEPQHYGYQVKPRYREIVCDWEDLDEGEEPFTVTIRRNLTFDQLNAIPNTTFQEVWPEIAPYVTAWNLTQDGEPVAPPAEAGPDAFKMLDTELNVWLMGWIKTAHLGGPAALAERVETERKKGQPPSASTPELGGGKSST